MHFTVMHFQMCGSPSQFFSYRSFFFFSDPSAILNIEKAISSGTALVLYNIDRDVDSLFMPLIYHITTSTSEEIEQGMLASLRCY